MTHDSIGLGEDGPTHQPVEHLASLRAIPDMLVFRPADQTETVECWQLALEARASPSILALTRQNLPQLRTTFAEANLCARGAYELRAAPGRPIGKGDVSIFASGSELSIAVAAQKLLAEKDIAARVVSVPCMDLFEQQSEAYRSQLIGDAPVKDRRRSRRPPGLGRHHRPEGSVHRHEDVRRKRPLSQSLRAFRHYAAGGGRSCSRPP